MKDTWFHNAVLIWLQFHFILSQGTYFERIDKNDVNEISMVGVTRGFHRCNLKKECNYVVKSSKNGAVEFKDSLESLSLYLAVWKKISISAFADCKQAQDAGVRESGTITLLLPNMQYVEAYCDMTTNGGGWTVIQRRADGSTNFTRNWQDYKQGFGNPDGDFWLGLEAIHQLTSFGNATLRFDLKNDNDSYGFAEYPNTKVHDEAAKYRLTLGPHSGSIGDGISTSNEAKFSTWDNDNDETSYRNCADFLKGGWWYYQCFFPSVNGPFYNQSNSIPGHMRWAKWGQLHREIKFSEMKVRRN